MQSTIVLPKDVRTFSTVRGSQIARTGTHLKAGSEIAIDEPCIMFYDHRDQLAVPIKNSDPMTFLIVAEIGIPTLVQ